MAFGTKDPNTVGGNRKVAGHAMSANNHPNGDVSPMGSPPKPRMPSAYHPKNHAPYDGTRKPAKGSIAEPPGVKMPKYDISRMDAPPPALKTTKAD